MSDIQSVNQSPLSSVARPQGEFWRGSDMTYNNWAFNTTCLNPLPLTMFYCTTSVLWPIPHPSAPLASRFLCRVIGASIHRLSTGKTLPYHCLSGFCNIKKQTLVCLSKNSCKIPWNLCGTIVLWWHSVGLRSQICQCHRAAIGADAGRDANFAVPTSCQLVRNFFGGCQQVGNLIDLSQHACWQLVAQLSTSGM